MGQLQEFKGLDYLLGCFAGRARRYPRVKLRVVYQTGALLDRYQAQAARLGLDGCLEFAGSKTSRRPGRALFHRRRRGLAQFG